LIVRTLSDNRLCSNVIIDRIESSRDRRSLSSRLVRLRAAISGNERLFSLNSSSSENHREKLVIFDFDGTLVDSRRLIVESHRVVFGEFGFSRPSEDESLSLIGMSLELVLSQLAGPDAPIEKMVAAYQRLLPLLRADTAYAEVPFSGAADLLAALAKRNGVRLGIATGHGFHAIAPALEHFGWLSYFCTIQTADKAPSKPHPGMVLQALSEANVSADDAVMIGDTAFDMEMATAAGVRGVAVSWGYHRSDRLKGAGASRIVNDMNELQEYLSTL
jgi:phosphoglycolate phosphatase